ncbi:hypothetical protein JOB18_036144 [Solea senegalensis]|uniref:Uncharacterized protein n=1 Tax=Solea senegalensis TaxID=28829 RepID=A0AAV6RD61_SOLSE|nr:hypothetical protein JOB18_036144 [Solea senegalensis]
MAAPPVQTSQPRREVDDEEGGGDFTQRERHKRAGFPRFIPACRRLTDEVNGKYSSCSKVENIAL